MKVHILAIGAHPDDVELGCSGTLAKLISEGKTAAIVDLTRGELGTRGTREIRDEEAAAAAQLLRVKNRINLNMPDGFFENNEENKRKIIEVIRYFQPDIVLCNAIEDRHPDHGRASQLVAEACFFSGLRRIETEYNGETQKEWRPKKVFHYVQWKEIKPDFVIDISEFIDVKVASCMAYKSQFYDPNSNEPLTPIATKDFQESIRYRAQNLGRLSGVAFAEAFTTESLMALKNFDAIVW